jgi:nucleotide-binding universal stress UspA family protein
VAGDIEITALDVRRILVPLDGSELAEAALPPARSLARRLGASIVLLHVLERDAPSEVHGEPHLGSAGDAADYLAPLADEIRAGGVTVEVDVHERPVADVAGAIDQHAHEHGAHLIAMCAHGRTNPIDRLLGSIAERILRGGSIPILLRTVRRPAPAEFRLRTLLVPIDFGHDVGAALSAARTLAQAYGAAVTLLSAPEPAAPQAVRLLPGATTLAREFDLEDVRRRLGGLAAALGAELPDVHAIVSDRKPTAAILDAIESLPADLVVLVTDAHSGLSAWFDPSTAQQLLARPDLTLLLIKEL